MKAKYIILLMVLSMIGTYNLWSDLNKMSFEQGALSITIGMLSLFSIMWVMILKLLNK